MSPAYFSLSELIGSNKAIEKKIKNIPNWEQLASLQDLAINYLDPIRKQWNAPITVSSGFRSLELNKQLKGSSTSSHLEGKAVDLQPNNPTKENVEKLWKFICKFLKENKMEWDQCYIENSQGKIWWVHLGLGDKMRCEIGSWTKK